LETIIQAVDLYDLVTLRSSEKLQVVCNLAELSGDNNLAYRAAILLQDYVGFNLNVEISVDKKIPVAAGLGGGSSNAAATLVGLNHLFELGLSSQELANLAVKLGADVPFFIRGGLQLGTGYGEILSPLNPASKDKPWFVLLISEEPLLTTTVYQAYDQQIAARSLSLPSSNLAEILSSIDKGISSFTKLCANDLEVVTFSCKPGLAKLKKKAASLATNGIFMSGSGPTLALVAKSLKQAQQLQTELEKMVSRIEIVQPINSGVSLVRSIN
jgi:4-diphosphocytidyl-2-C-methyl-D-erythritol kinase